MGLERKWFRPVLEWLAQPISRTSSLWPWIATLAFIVAEFVPITFYIARAVGILIWTTFFVGLTVSFLLRTMAAPQTLNSPIVRRSRRIATWGVLIGGPLCVAMSYLPINAFIVFWVFRSQFDDLAQRVPPIPINYRSFGDAKIGPYSPAVSRYITCFGIQIGGIYVPEHSRFGPSECMYFLQDNDISVGGKLPGFGDLRWWHISGNWYTRLP